MMQIHLNVLPEHFTHPFIILRQFAKPKSYVLHYHPPLCECAYCLSSFNCVCRESGGSSSFVIHINTYMFSHYESFYHFLNDNKQVPLPTNPDQHVYLTINSSQYSKQIHMNIHYGFRIQ